MSDRIRFPSSRMRRLKSLPVLPTIFTAGNLVCGVTAIMCAASGDLFTGCILILAGMVCDMIDGKAARLTGTESAFGAELDSIADVVSFGVAPALLVHRLVLGDHSAWIEKEGVWFITIAYPIATAIRLARYNVEHSTEATNYFKGLPSPGAAAVLCAWVLTYHYAAFLPGELNDQMFKRFILGMMIFVSILMVSNIRFPHLGNTILAGRMGFRRFMVIIGVMYALIYFAREHTMSVLTTGYVLYGFIPGVIGAAKKWQAGRSLLDDEDDDEVEPGAEAGALEDKKADDGEQHSA